jgi:hypothetical protein
MVVRVEYAPLLPMLPMPMSLCCACIRACARANGRPRPACTGRPCPRPASRLPFLSLCLRCLPSLPAGRRRILGLGRHLPPASFSRDGSTIYLRLGLLRQSGWLIWPPLVMCLSLHGFTATPHVQTPTYISALYYYRQPDSQRARFGCRLPT